MKRKISLLLAGLLLLAATACTAQGKDTAIVAQEPQMEQILESYYAAQGTEVYDYFQNNSVQRFLAMWVKEATGDIADPQWVLESFAAMRILDHDMQPMMREGDELYTCSFTDGGERVGYVVFRYEPEGPAIEKYSVRETSPLWYDLAANEQAIALALAETDIDLATATAERVSWLDRENNRSDQILLFTDGKGDMYICGFGDDDFAMEKLD